MRSLSWTGVRQLILVLVFVVAVAISAVATRITGAVEAASIWLGEGLIVAILLSLAVVGVATADNTLAGWSRLVKGYVIWAAQTTWRTVATVSVLVGAALGAWCLGPSAIYQLTVRCPDDAQIIYSKWNGNSAITECKQAMLLTLWRPLFSRTGVINQIRCRTGATSAFKPQQLEDDLLCVPSTSMVVSIPSIPNLWPNDTTLSVRFLDGDPKLIERVKPYISEWTRHANVKFVFVEADDADVRVSFKPRPGFNSEGSSYAFLGTESRGEPPEVPTVILGELSANVTEEDIAAVVLHAFGHVLGLIDEQRNPNAKIAWDAALVIREDSAAINGVPTGDPFPKVSSVKYATYRRFDPDSVMMEPFPPRWAFYKFSGKRNSRLSASDKEFIAKLYPK